MGLLKKWKLTKLLADLEKEYIRICDIEVDGVPELIDIKENKLKEIGLAHDLVFIELGRPPKDGINRWVTGHSTITPRVTKDTRISSIGEIVNKINYLKFVSKGKYREVPKYRKGMRLEDDTVCAMKLYLPEE